MSLHPPVRRLLAGPPATSGAESASAHAARLGPWRSAGIRGADLIDELEASGLLGRGGAGFPVGCKWRALAEPPAGPAVVVVNGAEGEPRSRKDRFLMARRPHLVLDGAMLAAEAIGAQEVIVYVGEEHTSANAALRWAIEERAGWDGGPSRARHDAPVRLVRAPIGYVAGEASAAVNYLNHGIALPTAPPRPSERGVDGRPTLVQNVESLAYAALIARFGSDWYREVGQGATRGTALVSVGQTKDQPVVDEIELGSTIGEVAARSGLAGADRPAGSRAVLIGGYFGTWTRADRAWSMALDPRAMRTDGLTFGCGMVSFLSADGCGVEATAEVMGFMARGSARQCGPCKYGLAAIADTADSLAACRAGAAELAELERLIGLVVGRGACHHPDGAAGLMASALETFGDEFDRHVRLGRCSAESGITDAVAPRRIARVA
jgi:NADH:ubiquinone oxidoreductase subunit F (NADH-binding)